MPTAPAKMADEVADNIKSLVDRMVDARLTQEIARRSGAVAESIAERGAEVGGLAAETWQETRPIRRDAAKRLKHATRDAGKWSDRAWRKSLRPALRDAWKRRALAMGAAGAAVPAGKELVDSAAVRLGLKQREERHWGAFFLGLILGAFAGAVVALMTAPKRGSEIRRELGERADEVRQEIAARAKEAEWVPLFQRDAEDNGGGQQPAADASGNLAEAAAGSGSATGEAADVAASDAAEAINESYDTVDRESTA